MVLEGSNQATCNGRLMTTHWLAYLNRIPRLEDERIEYRALVCVCLNHRKLFSIYSRRWNNEWVCGTFLDIRQNKPEQKEKFVKVPLYRP